MAHGAFGRGVIAGLLAAAVLAAWFVVIDFLKQQPLFTVAYMSGLLFSSTTALPATARVLVFVVLHFLAFTLLGVIAHRLLASVHIKAPLLLGIPLGLLLFGVLYVGARFIFDVDVAGTLGWWELLAGNMLAAAALLVELR